MKYNTGVFTFAITSIALRMKYKSMVRNEPSSKECSDENACDTQQTLPRVESEFSIGLSRSESVVMMNQLGEFCSTGKIALSLISIAIKSSALAAAGILALRIFGVSIYKRKSD